MKMIVPRSAFCLLVASLLGNIYAAGTASVAAGKNPAEELPPWITRLTHFGERADWSHDGKRILLVEKTFGDVYEVAVETRVVRPITHHFPHYGYTRALYLSNGDVLLSGPERMDPKKPGDARTQCWLSVLDKSFTKAPVALGSKCSEGPTVSRRHLRLAWTHVSAQYPNEMPAGSSRLVTADLVYEGGAPKLTNQRVVLESRDLPFKCTMESQNFVPPDEKQLTFSTYGYNGTEVALLDLDTRKVKNLTNSPEEYDEPEGVFPDGKFTLVECDRQNKQGWRFIDIWKLALDGSGYAERLTFFSDYSGFKSSNPVVSDDGRFMAFQMAKTTDEAGIGYGIFIYDFEKARAARK